MLELLRMDFVYFLALASLLIMLLGPVAGVWVALSIRRDIHRIADALATEAELAKKAESLELYFERKPDSDGPPRVANSAFGR
jgi:hypothetical protein